MENQSSRIHEALAIYRESKVMHAYAILEELRVYESSLEDISTIRSRAQSMIRLRESCSSDDGWTLQNESHDVRTLYKNNSDTPNVHSVRLDGDVDAPVFMILALFHEVDLFTRWIPSYALVGLNFAKCVHHPSPTELFVHMNITLPWPFLSRYCFFKCDGIDCMDDEIPQIGVILSVRFNFFCVRIISRTSKLKPSMVLLTRQPKPTFIHRLVFY